MTIEVFDFCITVKWGSIYANPGGDSHMKVTGMLVGKLELTPLKETNLGVAPALFNP